MIALHEQYIVDDKGDRRAVVLPLTEWQQVLDALEELDDIRAYDEAKRRNSDPMPFKGAVQATTADLSAPLPPSAP